MELSPRCGETSLTSAREKQSSMATVVSSWGGVGGKSWGPAPGCFHRDWGVKPGFLSTPAPLSEVQQASRHLRALRAR